jgi:hypothetical protein
MHLTHDDEISYACEFWDSHGARYANNYVLMSEVWQFVSKPSRRKSRKLAIFVALLAGYEFNLTKYVTDSINVLRDFIIRLDLI